MMQNTQATHENSRQEGLLSQSVAQNKVLKNTYALLAMTLVFSAFSAGMSMFLNLPHPGMIITLVGYFGLLFLTNKYQDQALGLVFVFALTGFMGITLGPMLNSYWAMAPQVVLKALGSTAVIFFGLSAYALTTKKNFNFMGSFIFVGILVAFVAGLAAIFLQMPALSLAVSAMFVLLMSGLILYQTSEIIHGGETNYISATVTLFVSIFNLFTSLLHLFGFSQSE
ncbi:MAG: modulator of FtsH protease [Phenylobacterium sp.]|jgi:modulator of FtsH protease